MINHRIIIPLLVITILLSNMAWAMDECALLVNVSGQNISQVTNISTDDGSESNVCDTFCFGWAHLLYIRYRTPFIKISNSHFDVIPRPSFYHSLQRKPPTAPPQV